MIVCPVRTVNDWVTAVAAMYDTPPVAPPVCSALIVHVPGPRMLTVPPLVTLHTPVEVVLNVMGNPAEEVAVTAKSAADGSLSLNVPNVIVWESCDKNERVTVGATA